MNTVTKTDFSGGINFKDGADKIAPNEYQLLTNARVRDGNVVPIKKARLLGGINASRFQGCYAFANYLLVAADGIIYWRDMAAENSNFNHFTNANGDILSMNNSVDIHFEAVTGSSLNWLRQADSASSTIELGSLLEGSPAAILIQDGLNQPCVVFPDGTWRVTQNYSQWSTANPEYVPIGTFMYFDGVILYIVSPDGKKLFRSVSGKPLDFVVIIDSTGAKAADATQSAFPITYGSISCIAPLFAADAFFVSTVTQGFIIKLDYNRVFFGEPYFNRKPLENGSIAPYSFTTINGDSIFVANNGITSLNAVESTNTKGNSAPFSRKIQKLFQHVEQDVPCAITFDDYGYFFVNTVFGPCILVHDAQLNAFVSLDIDDRLTDIKKFVIVDTATQQKLIVCTSTGIYCYNDADETAEVGLSVGDLSMSNVKAQGSVTRARALFARTFENGTVSLDGYVDGKKVFSVAQEIEASMVTIPAYPWPLPTPFSNSQTYKTAIFTREGKPVQGNKLGFWLRWDFNAELSALQIEYNESGNLVPPNQQS